MSHAPAAVTVTRHYDAPPAAVFDAWLDADCLGRWLFRTPDGVMERVAVDPRVGGRFTVVERRGKDLAEHFGEYLEIDRPRRLVFDFWTSFSEERTRVAIALAPDGEGTWLELTHEGVWADYEARTRQGWTMILDGLAHTLAD